MIIIPARIASNRFPAKVLADIHGEPMVIRVARRVQGLDDVAIATDSLEVADICKKYGFKAVMTSDKHKSGTDRVNEAATILGLDDDEVVINMQADEPFIEKEIIEKVIKRTASLRGESKEILMTSCYKLIDTHEADNPNFVKVVLDRDLNAVYFSRSKIPFIRDDGDYFYKGHLGIYGFLRRGLKIFCNLGGSELEDLEKLEQLRALYHGYKIAMVEVKTESFGIDTPEDLQEALKKFSA